MNKVKKVFGCVLICLMLISSVGLVSYGASEEFKSTLNFDQFLTGSTRTYKYKNVGYKYNNCWAENRVTGEPQKGVVFSVSLKMNTGTLGTYQQKGTVNNNPTNVGGTYWGYTFQNANTSGKSKKGYFSFGTDNISNTWAYIICSNFIMFSQT